MYYIQESDKPRTILKLFNIIELKDDKIILPIKDEKISSRQAQKLAQKTKKVLEKTSSKKIILSKEIKKQEEYVNLLYTYNLKIVDGRWLFELLSCKVLDYICKMQDLKKEELQLSILVNDLTENILSSLKKLVKEYKRVNIITNHVEKFKKIEEQVLEKEGIMITVGNNKKKGLLKSKIILNVDFPSELVNQYNIYEKAIIINLKGNVKITKKRFNGITINDYDITFEEIKDLEYEIQQKYKLSEIYESHMNQKQPYESLIKEAKKDKVEVTKLITKNGEMV